MTTILSTVKGDLGLRENDVVSLKIGLAVFFTDEVFLFLHIFPFVNAETLTYMSRENDFYQNDGWLLDP